MASSQNQNYNHHLKNMSVPPPRHNCLFIFGLQTGVSFIVILDYFILFFLLLLVVFQYREDTAHYQGQAVVFFTLITDGIIGILFLIKCWFGSKFLVNVCCPPRMSKKYKEMNQGKAKYKIMVLKAQRRELNWYFMASAVTYFFTIIQGFSLLFIFLQTIVKFDNKMRKGCFMIGFSIFCLLYLQRKMLQLLKQKDYELRYRSLNTSDSVIHSDAEDDEDKGSRYVPPRVEDSRSSYAKTNAIN